MKVFVRHRAPFRVYLLAEYRIQLPRNPFRCLNLPPLSVLSPGPAVQMDMRMVMAMVGELSAFARDWGAICLVCPIDGAAKAFSAAEQAT